MPGNAVAAGFHREHSAMVTRECDSCRHIRIVLTADHDRRVTVDHVIPYSACALVTRMLRPDRLAAEPGVQRGHLLM